MKKHIVELKKAQKNEIFAVLSELSDDVILCKANSGSMTGTTINIVSRHDFIALSKKFSNHMHIIQKELQSCEDYVFVTSETRTKPLETCFFITSYSGKTHLSWKTFELTNDECLQKD